MKLKNRFKRPRPARAERIIEIGIGVSECTIKCPACRELIERLQYEPSEYQGTCRNCGQRVKGLQPLFFIKGEDT